MIDENKQLNKTQEVQASSGDFSVSNVTIFQDSPDLVFLYKKTEKLVSALYILSSFISDKEPIKWQMRDAGVDLLSQSLSLSDSLSSERNLAYAKYISTALKFLSFLEVSFLGGIISEMNYNILKYEFEALIKTAESGKKGGDAKGLIFPDHFFEVPQNIPKDNLVAPANISAAPVSNISKGQNTLTSGLSVKKNIETVRTSEVKQKDKSNRQEIIIALLKKNPELGIKDFISSIKDCGEKTIQRELVSLVSKGLIKKAGEKRWSRYSLK